MGDAALWNSADLPVELRLVKETARRFAEESLRPLASQRDALRALPDGVCRAFGELGLGLAHVPRAVGGVGLGPVAACLTDEQLAAGDVNAAFALPQPGPFVDLVSLLGNRHQRKLWVHPFLACANVTWGALAIGPRGALRGRQLGGALRLSGEVPAVWGVCQAERLAVVVDEEDESGVLTGRRLAAVLEREDEGVHVGPPLALDGLPLAQAAVVRLAQVAVPKSQVLTSPHLEAALDHVFCAQALRMASYALGAARAASAYVLGHVEGRRRDKRPMAQYQSMGFLLVDMHLAAEAALSRLRQAAAAAAAAELGAATPPEADVRGAWPTPATLSTELIGELAKLRAEADEVAFFVTDSAVQMLEEAAAPGPDARPVRGWHRDVTLLARSYPPALHRRGPLPEAGTDGGPGWLS